MEALRYRDVISELFRRIPEAEVRYREWNMPGEPLPYMVLSFLEESILSPSFLTDDGDPALLSRILESLECMALSPDTEVVTLLWVGLFEAWAADSGQFSRVYAQMRPNTKLLAQEAAREFGLPRL